MILVAENVNETMIAPMVGSSFFLCLTEVWLHLREDVSRSTTDSYAFYTFNAISKDNVPINSISYYSSIQKDSFPPNPTRHTLL
jgi:hypothetical protein